MKVVILGKGLMLANLILGVKDSGAKICGVFRYEYTTSNNFLLRVKDFFNPSKEAILIKELKLNELQFSSANSKTFREFLIKENIDLVIIGTWKEKIKKETYQIPTIGTINVHPSLLPKYRGPNPYLQTILNGEEYSGLTLHLIDDNYDTGAVLAQKRIKILSTDTSKELREKTVSVARTMISDFIQSLNNRIITPTPQVTKNASYYSNISGDERMLDFTTQTSDEISRTIRALHPFLPTYITYKKSFFIVNPYKFEIINKSQTLSPGTIIEKSPIKNSLTIICKDQKAIRFENLILYKANILTRFYIQYFIALQ